LCLTVSFFIQLGKWENLEFLKEVMSWKTPIIS